MSVQKWQNITPLPCHVNEMKDQFSASFQLPSDKTSTEIVEKSGPNNSTLQPQIFVY